MGKESAHHSTMAIYDTYLGAPFDSDYFNGNADWGYTNYSSQSIQNIAINRAININAHYAVSGEDVIVLGCAYGYLVDELNKLGANAEGLDISSYAIGQAETLFPSYTFHAADALDTGLKKNSYDIVVACLLLGSMPTDVEIDALIQEMAEIGRAQASFYFLLSDASVAGMYNYKDNWGTYIADKTGKSVVMTNVKHIPIGADVRVVID